MHLSQILPTAANQRSAGIPARDADANEKRPRPRLLLLATLFPLLATLSAPAQITIPITSDSTQPTRLTLSTGTQIYDVADGITFTLENIASGASAAVALSAGAGFQTTGAGTTAFVSNTSSSNGGAFSNNSGGALGVTNAVFEANQGGIGGAVYIITPGGLQSFDHVRFGVEGDPSRGNIATRRGGVIAISAAAGNTGTLAISNAEFYGNRATAAATAGSDRGGGGGAIALTNNAGASPIALNITNAVFEQNAASVSGGGALYFASSLTGTLTNVRFGSKTDLTRGNNTTSGNGGAIIVNTGKLVLVGAEFYGNSTQSGNGSGGAIAVHGGTLSVTNAVFASNTTSNSTSAHGSAIFVTENSYISVASATFSNNLATGAGALFLNTTALGALVENSVFEGNYSAGSQGGAVTIQKITASTSTVTINNTLFNSNTAGGMGGALRTRSKTVLNDVTFTNNHSNANGGALAIDDTATLLEYNATANATHSGNSAGADGTAGGFLWFSAGGGTANFNLAPSATVTIGGASATHDSLASAAATAVINLNNAPDTAGTLILDTADSSAYLGTLNIRAGRLLLVNSATLGGAITVANSATLGGAGALAGAGTLATGATLQVGEDGAAGATQTLAIAGTLALAPNTAIIGDGILTTPGTGLIEIGSTAGDTVTANINAGKLVSITGAATGTGGLLKTGGGALGLSGANTFSGGVTLASGTLLLGNDTALGTGTLAVIGTGATAGFSAAATVANTITLGTAAVFDSGAFTAALTGAISGPGGITKTGSGRLDFNGTLSGVPSLAITAGTVGGDLSSVPLVSISNTAAYAGDLARASGQTLSVTTGSIAGNLVLSQGAALEFDLAAAGSGAALALSGTVAASGTTTVNLLNLDNATYTIISAGSVTATAANFAYTVNGGALTGRNSIAVTFTSTDITLAASYRNLRMSWTGANGGTWDTLASNWSDAATSAYGETHFVNGDSVRFAAAASGTVAIAPAGVTAGDIEVASTGALTFTGGSITASGTAASVDGVAGGVSLGASGTVATTGKLVKKGAGVLMLDNDSGSFAGGLDIEGGTLAFNRAAQLGDASGTVSFTSPATLRADGDILGSTGTLAGTLALAGASGTFDTQGFTVESVAMLAGTGTLVKTGAGKLILRTTDNSAFTAPTTVAAGALLLADGAKLGGALTVAPGATAGGAGAFTGAVTVNNATLLVGAADSAASASGTLAIGGALTLTGTARVQFAIHAGGAADILDVTGAITTATASNIVALSFGVIGSGTYALGNAAALASVQNLEVNGVLVDESLRIVSELTAASGTLLYIYGADDSRYMEWTGASGTARWNIGLANWQGYNGDTAGKTKFQDGDTVRFTGAASASIALDSAVTVSDLLVDNTGTLAFTGAALTADTAVNGALITGAAGKLVKTGAGALIFENTANTFSGGVALNAGLVAISSAAQLNTAGAGLALASGTLRALGALAFSDTFTLTGGAAALDTGANAVTLSGGIAGTGTLAKLGAGALTLSAATAGENLLAATAVTRVVDGAVLLRDFSPAAAAATAHTFILDGGFLDLSVTPGFNGATGTNALDWTNLRVTGTGGAVIGSNDKLTLRDGDTLATIGGTTTAQQGLFVVVDAGAGGIATLTGSSNYAGRTLLQSGTLRVAANDSLGQLTLNREVRFTGSGAALEITGDGFTSNRPLALDENGVLSVAAGASATWTGTITGAGKTLAKAGAGELVLTNTNNTATLAYHVAEGVLETTAAALAARAVTADAGATFALNVATSATHTPNLTGAGAFEKRGAGVLTLAAALGNTGAVRVAAGVLQTTANNQFNAASPLIVGAGATLDLRGTRQTAASLALDGALLVSATVNSNAGVILAADYLKLTDSLAGTGTIAVSLSESAADGYSPINGPAPSSVVLVESADAAGANLAVSVTGADPDAIFGWDMTRDGDNYLLGQKRLVPVIPAAAGINAAALIGTETSFDAIATRVNYLRLSNDGAHRPGNDWWIAGAYRHDTINAPLYDGAGAITQNISAGVNLVKGGFIYVARDRAGDARSASARFGFAAGVFIDFTETDMRLADARAVTKTNAAGLYVTWQPNAAFYADLFLRATTGRHAVQVEDVDELRIGTTGIGAAVVLGYTVRAKSGWLVEPRMRFVWNSTGADDVTDSAHRVFKTGDLTSFSERAELQVSRQLTLAGKFPLRPRASIAYAHEFKGQSSTTVLRYYAADQTRLRDRHEIEDDLSGGSLALSAGANLRLHERFETYLDASTKFGGELEDYTINLGASWRW
jgi:autotransporter-associated beta strand protein